MRIGILVPSIGAFGQKGFYNAQEVGLAKALGMLCKEVIVYRLVDISQEERTEKLENCENAEIHFIPSNRVGNNGLVDVSMLDKTLDVLVFFSDTQFSVPCVYRWAKKNDVIILPYIGVVESHSTNKIKKKIVDWLFHRNLAVYRRCHCLVKTPSVKEKLEKWGVSRVTVTPVGLDQSLLKWDAQNVDLLPLKEKYSYQPEDKVLLFVGRLIDEKQPIRMIDIFFRVSTLDVNYKLLMVGTGELREAVESAITEYGLTDRVQMIDRIPNSQIWELYRVADCFVNLNQQEIFGMAILEAMYYGCKVVAWEAPGPSFIIEDGKNGCLADSDAGIITAICRRSIQSQVAMERILSCFTWESTAKQILTIARTLC